jgi:hypothetical protein
MVTETQQRQHHQMSYDAQKVEKGIAELRKYSTVRPPRVVILAEAQSLTWGERDKEYGDPLVNLTAAAEGKAWLDKWIKRDMSPAEREALLMVITKLSRLITGTPKQDSYVDLAGYAALAGEMAERAAEPTTF